MTYTRQNGPPERGGQIWPPVEEMQLDAGFADLDEEQIRELAGGRFRAANPQVTHEVEIATLEAEAGEIDTVKRGYIRTLHATDPIETVVAAEPIAKAHWLTKATGWFTGFLGLVLLVPVVLIAAAGVEESLLIERVIAEPAWAFAYGFAPFAAVLAAHGIRGALFTDRARRIYDLVVYVSALGAFAAWVHQFGPTFLTNVLADPSAASTRATSLSDFYTYQLCAEILGAAAAYSAAVHMLTAGARIFAKLSEKRVVLSSAIEQVSDAALLNAREQDWVNAQPSLYDASLKAYQDHCVAKVEVARKLLATRGAGASLDSFIAIRTTLLEQNEGETNA